MLPKIKHTHTHYKQFFSVSIAKYLKHNVSSSSIQQISKTSIYIYIYFPFERSSISRDGFMDEHQEPILTFSRMASSTVGLCLINPIILYTDQMRICFCTKTSSNANDMLIRRIYYFYYLGKKYSFRNIFNILCLYQLQ